MDVSENGAISLNGISLNNEPSHKLLFCVFFFGGTLFANPRFLAKSLANSESNDLSKDPRCVCCSFLWLKHRYCGKANTINLLFKGMVSSF